MPVTEAKAILLRPKSIRSCCWRLAAGVHTRAQTRFHLEVRFPMSVLVIGGTGTVGSQVVRGLRAKDVDVRVMTRAPDKARHFPDGVEAALGDLAEPRTLPTAFEGVEKLFMITPLSRNETELGLAGVEAAREAGVEQIVYMTIHQLEEGAHIPHFGSKIPIVDAIKESGRPYTIIEPNNFYQNDLWFKEPITQMGIYPQPLGSVGVSRVDVRDIADAVINALTREGSEGEAYPVVGPDALTGEVVAETYSRHLERDVSYVGDDLDAWEEGARAMMPDWLVEDLRIMYQHFLDKGLKASEDDLSRCKAILGHAPRDFDDYALEMTRS